MRNLKKVLTLVLTVAMVLSIMVVGTGAAFSDQDQIKNKEAVDVCTTLNIIAGMEDGSYRPANNVTRAQMCKMICVALNGGKEPTLGTNATPTFSDVRTDPSSSWAESFIESCNSQGIVSGVGGGRFSPSGSVTGTQAARMLLVALGYRADQEGFTGDSWAINVNTLASAKGLYKGIESIDANAALSRDNAAQMIWNALNAYEVEYISQLSTVNGVLTSELVAQDKVVGDNRDKITMLEDKYEADTAIGTFTGNHDMYSSIRDGNIRLSNTKINGSGNGTYQFKHDFDLKYIGEELKVLYRDGIDGVKNQLDDKDTIYGVYVTGTTTVYNIIKDDIQKVTTNKIRFGDVDHDYTSGTININYGNTIKVMNQSNLTDLKVASGDTVKLIENANGMIDTAYVTHSDITKVSAVNSTKVSLENVGSITIEDNDVYSGIAEDDVVVYTQLYNSNKDDATFVVTKADTVSGTVKSYKDVEKVAVDGTTYFVDELVATANSNKLPDLTKNSIDTFKGANLEKTATLYLINGFVGAADSQAVETSYALVTAKSNMGTIGDPINGAKVQLLTLDGKTIYNVDKDSKDNFTGGSKPALSTLTSLTEGQIVEFTLTSDDTVEIKNVVTTKFQVAGSSGTPGIVYDKDAKALTTGSGVTTIADADAVFFANISNTDTDYKAYKLRSLNDIKVTSNTDVFYVLNSDNNKVLAAFANLGKKPSGASSDTLYGMIIAAEQNVKVDNAYYNKYIVHTGDSTDGTTIYTKDVLSKGNFVYFDKTSDDLYASGEVKVLNGTGVSKYVCVTDYEETENGVVLSYLSGAKEVPMAVDKDVTIVYVDYADKSAGDNTGMKYDKLTGYENALYVDLDNDKKIDAIFFDENKDILDKSNSNAVNDLDNAISRVTEPVLTGIESQLGAGSVKITGNTVTITGTATNVNNYVLTNSGLFNALREITNFKEATFVVDGVAVSGKLTANNHDADNATLWSDLQAKLTSAKADGKITEVVTVKLTTNVQTSFTVVINIQNDAG